MPTCPVCERPVSYDRLAVHERYCAAPSEGGAQQRQFERLDRQIGAVERRMYRRLRALESELEIKRSRTDERNDTDGRSRKRR